MTNNPTKKKIATNIEPHSEPGAAQIYRQFYGELF